MIFIWNFSTFLKYYIIAVKKKKILFSWKLMKYLDFINKVLKKVKPLYIYTIYKKESVTATSSFHTSRSYSF